MLKLSCTLNPWPGVEDHAKVAESLGYDRVWINDSPNLFPDVWMTLSSIAAATEQIGIGPAVIVPSLRHVVVTAAAIATLEQMSPGRVAVTVGTGNTGRRLLGKNPQPWREVVEYVELLRQLLKGDIVEIDGEPTAMLHPPGMVDRSTVPPILLAAMGPVGVERARGLADGIFRINHPVSGFGWCAVTVTGTVLDTHESFNSPRVLRDAGPGVTLAYHQAYDQPDGAAQIEAMPHGTEWLHYVESLPEKHRHLTVHRSHFTSTDGPDALLVDAETVARYSFSDTPENLRVRLDAIEVGGGTEIVFHPVGVDTARELEAFARVLRP